MLYKLRMTINGKKHYTDFANTTLSGVFLPEDGWYLLQSIIDNFKENINALAEYNICIIDEKNSYYSVEDILDLINKKGIINNRNKEIGDF